MTHKKHSVVAITGASGFLGSGLVDYFSAKGWNVVALVRNPDACTPTKNVQYVAYDLSKPFNDSILKGVDLIVHAAYVKYDRKHPDALALNTAGAERLLSASRKQKVSRNVFISSMSAHDEAVSTYGLQKVAVEKHFNTRQDTTIRSGLIIDYGGIVRQMLDFMKTKRLVPLIGGGMQPLQIISITDLARCIESIYNKQQSGLLTLATPRVYTYKDFYMALGKRIGVTPIFLPVPFFALQSALKLASLLHIELSINEDNLLGLKMLRSAETKKDLQKLGIEIDELEDALKKVQLPF